MAPGAPRSGAPVGGRGQRLAAVATVLAVLLLCVSVAQGAVLLRLDQRLDAADAAADSARQDSDQRVADLENRARELERTVIDPTKVAAAVTPSVFKVNAQGGIGTGFAFGEEPDGGGTDFVTNYHVVKGTYTSGGRDVDLERNNKRYTARIVTVDETKDLAVLHTSAEFPRLRAATSAAKPGEPIVVVGAPLGGENTVTSGVVSALRTTTDGPFVQFDAAINPGSSGGPVVNAQKVVVGVATAKVMDAEGIGFAIPIEVVCETFGIC
ncbi:MAG: trypsin-like serine protease [Dactylosporangium sp.]|nr:S1C family serine protease [Dactylosporangium sp.]NNJ62667.1 trypsin-like serine protease [Dactylosporangium sp.]